MKASVKPSEVEFDQLLVTFKTVDQMHRQVDYE